MIRVRFGVSRLAIGVATIALAAPAAEGAVARDSAPAAAVAGLGPGTTWSELAVRRDALRMTWLRQPAPPPTRPPLLRRLRKSTVSVGFQGSYGLVRGSSRLADGFNHGPGYAFRFRYMVSRRAALGFSFENQTFGPAAEYTPEDTIERPDTTLSMTTAAIEGVLYFHRERVSHPYLVGGFGYASPDVVFKDQGSRRTSEGPFLVLGAGLEYFAKPRISFDLTLRGYGQIGNSELSSFAQLNAGVHLYPGD